MISTVDHSRTPLLDQVAQQAKTAHQRFYMPGHKGGRGSSSRLINMLGRQSLQADVPELPELDQLFAPSGVIHEAQALAADAFGADQTYFLVNGTSVGLMAAIMTICAPGEQIVVPRNCHQSIIHGLILSGAHPIWVYPELEPGVSIPYCLSPNTLKTALENFPQAKAAIAISPTYEGVCGDIKSLAAIAHQHNIPLIVDEAHGAHLCFHPVLPPSALSQDADLVVQSTHKMLGALTQASMLHTQGDRINHSKLQNTLTLLQSSSPSYLLLASLDAARYQMAVQGQEIIGQTLTLSGDLREQLTQLDHIQVLSPPNPQHPGFITCDPFKLTLNLSNCSRSGFELDDILSHDHQILAELPAEQAITFLLGHGNSHDDLNQLFQAIKKIESQYCTASTPSSEHIMHLSQPPTLSALPPKEAFYHPSRMCPLEQASGQLSATLICPYPPGIPVIFPGEVITPEAIAALTHIQNTGGQIIGLAENTKNSLAVLE